MINHIRYEEIQREINSNSLYFTVIPITVYLLHFIISLSYYTHCDWLI